MFTARAAEVEKILDDALSKMADTPRAFFMPVAQQEEIRDKLDRYFDFRQKALEEALKLLNNDSVTAKEQSDKWRKHLLGKGSEGAKMIADSIKDIKRSSLFKDEVARIGFSESVFFTRLAHMQLPNAMQGKLIEYRREFEEEKKKLLDKWKDLLDKDKGIDSKMDETTNKLLQLYKEGLKKVDAANTKARENLTKYLKAAHVADEATSPGTPSILEPVNAMMSQLNIFMTSSKELAKRFEALYKSEETVVVILFGKTRAGVKEFLEKTNLDKALDEYEEAGKKCLDVANSFKSAGQKADAVKFVTESARVTKKHMEAFTKAYNDFVNAFRGIFIGPVGDRTVEDLVEKQRWDYAKNEWQRLNIQTELKKMYDDAREWWAVDLDDLHPAVKEHVEKLLEKERKRLEPALREAGDNSVLDALKQMLTIEKMLLVDKIKRLKGWLS
ncbi:MAG: hypothetical protein KDD04_02225 [Sinomicrobium sp.]|nr:hypothetical protein [Sinomicrobium sp.]